MILQSLYAGYKGLFQRVIAGSGSSIYTYYKPKNRPDINFLNKLTWCSESLMEPVECLRNIPAENFRL